jgi:transcriptional regulator with XRE-family HTH domain
LKVNGSLIKRRRRELKMTQNQLAEGICKQATISNIEKKNRGNSMNILIELCARLDLSIKDVTQITEFEEVKEKFQSISQFIYSDKLSEANQLMEQMTIDEEDLPETFHSELHFYQGYLELFFKGNESKGLYYLHKVVLTKTGLSSVYRVLSNTALLKFYLSKQMYSQAHSFITDVQEELEQSEELVFDQRVTAFYFEAADYYLQTEEFDKGVAFCKQGLSVCVSNYSLLNLGKLSKKKAQLMEQLGDTNAAAELEFSDRVEALVRKQQ